MQSNKNNSKNSSLSNSQLYLIIDNFDSFTYNLFQLFATVTGREPLVVYNNTPQSEIKNLLEIVDAVIISPGPGSPNVSEDIGVCRRVIEEYKGPILGICMGLQVLNVVYGGKIILANKPVHGRYSQIYHSSPISNKQQFFTKNSNSSSQNHFLFNSIPSPFRAIRYNSLICDFNSLDENNLEILCVSYLNESLKQDEKENVEIMGLGHKTRPIYGVQFHPESICTEHGRKIIENFNEFVQNFHKNTKIKNNLSNSFKNLLDQRIENLWTKNCKNLNSENSKKKLLNGVNSKFNEDEDVYTILYRKINFNENSSKSKIDKILFQIFQQIFSNSSINFQLESSKREDLQNSRFTYMGSGEGPLSVLYEFSLNNRLISISSRDFQKNKNKNYWSCVKTSNLKPNENFFTDFFEPQINKRRCKTGLNLDNLLKNNEYLNQYVNRNIQNGFECNGLQENKNQKFIEFLLDEAKKCEKAKFEDFPFGFNCGFVGYIGYEMKSECQKILQTTTLTSFNQNLNPNFDPQNLNNKESQFQKFDTRILLSDRLLVYDYLENQFYLLTLIKINSSKDQNSLNSLNIFDSINQLIDTSSKIEQILKFNNKNFKHKNFNNLNGSTHFSQPNEYLLTKYKQDLGESWENLFDIKVRLSQKEYLNRIDQAINYINNGQCYEMCLTTQVFNNKPIKLKNPLDLYKDLRKTNPAPYSAYIRFSHDLVILCCSPELFLKIDSQGQAECKPIKGTLPRGQNSEQDKKLRHCLATNEKEMSENLMIVDLMRNDLGRVCKIGSVSVPKLMHVESYSTVHQLVSTIKGQLLNNVSAVQCFGNVFPPGSMTGAPKVRAMHLLESMEEGCRGIYSGSIGFFGLNGSAVLNVVIRTILLKPHLSSELNLWDFSLGAGGAIVSLSDKNDEYIEMLLKTKAPLNSLLKFKEKESVLFNGNYSNNGTNGHFKKIKYDN